ncbi:MAG: disulfide bond formation protein B [Candidatus Berkiella sp.]
MVTFRTMSARVTFLALTALALLVVAGSFILQYGFKLQPCSLCIIDRALVMVMVVIFLVAFFHNPKKVGQLIYGLLGFLVAVAGIAVTARHLWLLQLPPDKVPECGPGLSYLLETMPFQEALMVIFKGSGECAKNVPYFLGLSLPSWTMIAFILLAMASWIPWYWGRKK